MDFQIPEDLGQFSANGLADLSKQAEAEYATLFASVTPDTISDEDLDDLEALQTFTRISVPDELKKRQSRNSRFSALQTQPDDPEGGDGNDGPPPPADTPATTTFSSDSTKSDVIEVKLSDIVDSAIESCLICLGRFGETAQLTDELKRRRANFVLSGGWTEVMKCFDGSTHVGTINTSQSTINYFVFR